MLNSEPDWVERKESLLKEKDKIYQAICAFMNDMPVHRHPGVLFIGVDDRGCPTQLLITDELLTTMAQMRPIIWHICSGVWIIPSWPSTWIRKRT